ncbi:MAG: gamma-glutamyl-gamma-aminobutyrate hydrolase family protein [Oscillospiraceae bacterium]|nr:gamma-glutamyl-gamma-aminobutyrate hydrolase family protein [Oscillospiraceae bacterium]MBQ2178491.1 gamma-glutamyl-gamma-aminobutyrate hydrolase family protein [Oscillospiraceae bacterium]
MRPVIGISAHPTLHDYRGNKSTIQSCGENYLFSLEAVGAVPLILPIYDDPEALDRYVGLCDGYLIPGGIDVNPISYGETPHPLLETTRLDFDEYQLHLIERMRVSKKPVLAICRGIQIVNVAYGGTLYQDVSLHGEGTMRHSQVDITPGGISHRVSIEDGSILHRLYGSELWTNSYHHQSIKDLGAGLRITARADDGIIEAVEATDHPYLHAVQWHPESFFVRPDNYMLAIFEDFVKQCRP